LEICLDRKVADLDTTFIRPSISFSKVFHALIHKSDINQPREQDSQAFHFYKIPLVGISNIRTITGLQRTTL
jgi:hypothetical protein